MNDTVIIIKYFQLYIEEITKGKDSYFISFCNVDMEIFEKLKLVDKPFGDDISLVFINRDEYYEAVRLRNDKSKKKIVILTSKSVKNIDSLKHFQSLKCSQIEKILIYYGKFLSDFFPSKHKKKYIKDFFKL